MPPDGPVTMAEFEPTPAPLDISKTTPAAQPEPPVDNPLEASDDADTSGAAAPDGEGSGAPKEPSEAGDVPPWVKARLSREENRRKAAEADTARLREDLSKALDALPKVKPEEPPAAEPRPKREAYTDPDAYDEALIEWAAKQTEGRVRESVKTETAQEAAKRGAQELADKWVRNEQAFAEEHPEYEEAQSDVGTRITQSVAIAIAAEDQGPAIVLHLHQHPEEADRLNALSPVHAAIAIGKLAAQLSQPAAQPKPKPNPITPVGARQKAGTRSPDEMSGDEYYDSLPGHGRQRSTAGIL